MSEYKIDYCHHDSVTTESRQDYIKREDAIEYTKEFIIANRYGLFRSGEEQIERLLNILFDRVRLPSIEIEDDSIILSPEAYIDLCLRAADCKYKKKCRQKASKPNTCGTCKWRCGRKTSVGIECMQPDNQKKWQAKDTPHRECVARYKTAGTTCKRYAPKEQENE